MSDIEQQHYVIEDLDGYWTIVESESQFLVSKFGISESMGQQEFISLAEAEDYVLKKIYAGLLGYAG